MARFGKEGNTAMADEAAPKKTRKAQGPRKPSSFYLFAKADEAGKITVAQAFKSPHKMAEYFNTAQANGEQLVVITPEA